YRVYRYKGQYHLNTSGVYQSDDGRLARAAAGWAAAQVERRADDPTYGAYAFAAAATSPFSLMQRTGGGRQVAATASHECTTFFCSNFVFKAYAAASAELGLELVRIKHGRSQIGPRDLMIAFDKDKEEWEFMGRFDRVYHY